uniref:Phosphatidylinositol N-acetylglucosaminyltransferase subunit Q n=1 Tax=Globisporangium ultimum (strain ATCC 200006 / CBS 805.95 / DAOM BR144) TaxID=431595 RepID=K3X368_GLOUD
MMTDALETLNCAFYLVLDFLFGRLLTSAVLKIVLQQLQSLELSPEVFLTVLRSNVAWLMGAPAGFKLNAPLASILGNGILLWFDFWEYVFSLVISTHTPWYAFAQSAWPSIILDALWRNMGATLQLSLLADMLAVCTWNTYWVYQYFTKLNMLQFGLFSSLWKLFLGKKNNVLRKRVDSCEYDVSQLLLGTLLFTILFFVVTTNMVFFLYFGLVRLSIFVTHAALWLPIVGLRTLPIASMVYWWWRPSFFVAAVRLESCPDLQQATAKLDLFDVGTGVKRPADDADAQQQIAEIVARHGLQEPHTQGKHGGCAYFWLVPAISSLSSLFTRLRQYSQALREQYSAGAVMRSWFFGSKIVPIPLAILFDCSHEVNSPLESASHTAMRTSAEKKNL